MSGVRAGARLLWRFALACLLSGLRTTWIILRPPSGLTPGLVDYRFAPMGENAATVLACLICLTPGTSVVDVDARAGRMRLHMLDTREKDAALAEIRLQFEHPLRVLYGEERA